MNDDKDSRQLFRGLRISDSWEPSASVVPPGWAIIYNPIPDRRHDYDFVHDDYDGADDGNGLHGTAPTVADAIRQIQEIEAERRGE